MKIRLLIVDDERIARQRLRRLLATDPEIEIVGECADGASALAAITAAPPDVVLLDVQMPGMDGFGVLAALPATVAPTVIFVTAFNEHAVRALDACALDYLLKPVSPERLGRAISRARERLALVQAAASRPILPPPAAPSAVPSPTVRFTVRGNSSIAIVTAFEIEWIEAAGNYAILHTGQKNHILRETMATLESTLPAPPFLRVSRGAIVNLSRVKSIRTPSDENGPMLLLASGATVAFTRSIREIQERLRALPAQ